MPFYTDLRIGEHDRPAEIERKRRNARELLSLRMGLRNSVGGPTDTASRSGATLRLGTWNLREFDAPSYGSRLREAIFFIAEIVSHFDLVALQEVRQDLTALAWLKRVLGPDWEFICTDAAEGSRNNRERLAFLYNTRKVFFRGIVGELTLVGDQRLFMPNSFDLSPRGGPTLVLPEGGDLPDPGEVRFEAQSSGRKLKEEVAVRLPAGTQVALPEGCELVFSGSPPELGVDGRLDLKSGVRRQFSEAAAVRWPSDQVRAEDLQFARTPYIVYFQSGWLKVALCTVHIYYGDDKEGSLKMERRRREIAALSAALAEKAAELNDSDADSYFVALGDFNIVGRDHGTMAALESNNFVVPDEIKQIPAGTNVKRDKYYDQIAFWKGETRRPQRFRAYTSMKVVRAGVFDYFDYVFRAGSKDPGGDEERFYTQLMQDVLGDTWAYKTWRTYQMSDHLPMWVEFQADFSDDYLRTIADGGS
jgi:endonuclease/exonuclease/phosphatase family metal-dependent hydrolase